MRSYHFAKSSCVLFCKTWVHEIGLKSCNIYTHSATHYPRVSRNISTQVARARDFYTQTLHRHMTSILWHAVKCSHWFCTRLTFQRRPQTSGWFHRRVFSWQVPSAQPQHVTSTSINNNKNHRHTMHNDVLHWHATQPSINYKRCESHQQPVGHLFGRHDVHQPLVWRSQAEVGAPALWRLAADWLYLQHSCAAGVIWLTRLLQRMLADKPVQTWQMSHYAIPWAWGKY